VCVVHLYNTKTKDVDDTPIVVSGGLAGGKIQEMEQQMLILRLEKELNTARNKLSKIRQAEYKK